MSGGASGTSTGTSAGVGGIKGHMGVNGPGPGFGTSGRQGILDPRSFNDNVQYSLFGRMENRNSSTSSSSSNNGDGTGDSDSRLKFLRLSGRESGANREDGNYNYNYNYTDKKNSNNICEKVNNNNNSNNDDDDDSDNHNDRRGISPRMSTDRGTDIHRRMDNANILGMGMGMGIDVDTSRNKDTASIQSHSRPQARNVMRDRMEDISQRNSNSSSSGTAHHERGTHSIVKHSNSSWNERRNHYENKIKVEKHDSSKSRSEDGSYYLDVSNERQMNIDDMRGNESKKDLKVERRMMKKNNNAVSNCAYSLWGLEDDYYNKNRTRNMKYEIKNEIDNDIGPDAYRYGEGNNPLDICHGFESKKQSQSEQQQREMGGDSDRGTGTEMERRQNKNNAVSSSRYWLMGCGVDPAGENEGINFNVTSEDNETENANEDVSHTNEDILVQEQSSHRHNHRSNADNNNMSNNSEGSDNNDMKGDSSVRSRSSEVLKMKCDDEEHSQDIETDTDNEREPRMTHNVSSHSSFTLSSICDDDDVEADSRQNCNIHHSNSNSSNSHRNRNRKKNSSRKSEIRINYDSNCDRRDDISNYSDYRENEAIPDHDSDRNSFEGAGAIAGAGAGLLREDKALSSYSSPPPISRGEHQSTSGREIFGMHGAGTGTGTDAPSRPGRSHYHSYQGAESNLSTASRDNASSDSACDAVYESARAGMNAVTLKKRKHSTIPPLSTSSSTSSSIPIPTFPTESARMPSITTTTSPSSSRSLLHSLVDLLEQHQELDYIAETQTRQQGSSHIDDNNSNIKGADHINNNRKDRDRDRGRDRIAEHSNSIASDSMAL